MSKETKFVHIHVALEPDVMERLRARAAQEERSCAAVIRRTLRLGLQIDSQEDQA